MRARASVGQSPAARARAEAHAQAVALARRYTKQLTKQNVTTSHTHRDSGTVGVDGSYVASDEGSGVNPANSSEIAAANAAAAWELQKEEARRLLLMVGPTTSTITATMVTAGIGVIGAPPRIITGPPLPSTTLTLSSHSNAASSSNGIPTSPAVAAASGHTRHRPQTAAAGGGHHRRTGSRGSRPSSRSGSRDFGQFDPRDLLDSDDDKPEPVIDENKYKPPLIGDEEELRTNVSGGKPKPRAPSSHQVLVTSTEGLLTSPSPAPLSASVVGALSASRPPSPIIVPLANQATKPSTQQSNNDPPPNLTSSTVTSAGAPSLLSPQYTPNIPWSDEPSHPFDHDDGEHASTNHNATSSSTSDALAQSSSTKALSMHGSGDKVYIRKGVVLKAPLPKFGRDSKKKDNNEETKEATSSITTDNKRSSSSTGSHPLTAAGVAAASGISLVVGPSPRANVTTSLHPLPLSTRIPFSSSKSVSFDPDRDTTSSMTMTNGIPVVADSPLSGSPQSSPESSPDSTPRPSGPWYGDTKGAHHGVEARAAVAASSSGRRSPDRNDQPPNITAAWERYPSYGTAGSAPTSARPASAASFRGPRAGSPVRAEENRSQPIHYTHHANYSTLVFPGYHFPPHLIAACQNIFRAKCRDIDMVYTPEKEYRFVLLACKGCTPPSGVAGGATNNNTDASQAEASQHDGLVRASSSESYWSPIAGAPLPAGAIVPELGEDEQALLEDDDGPGWTFGIPDAKLGVESIRAVCHYLRTNKQYSRLNLSGNPFGDEGALLIAALLAQNSALTSLDLRATNMSQVDPSFYLSFRTFCFCELTYPTVVCLCC
jgi:hypothetical protein